ncbi:MAG: SDR family NAD(P)-dependent oxidoreductase [Alphaproteobacteria bacterium]|nr:SDR family NAD(P)-dependent oxidoreductase [Alphaproteobacteria bacterium]
MEIKGCTALVTGANRGIGAAFVEGLIAAGAAKIYDAARDLSLLPPRPGPAAIVRLKLDIRDAAAIAAAARTAADVTLLINNAGINFNTPLLAAPTIGNARAEIETNYLGTLAMIRAFAPVLARNGGGAIVNMLSILARVNLPLMGSLCATKAALHSLTQGVRAELAKQRTLVVGVMPGAVETRMTEMLTIPKMQPAEVVTAALAAVREGLEDVYPGAMAIDVARRLGADVKAVEKEFAGFL